MPDADLDLAVEGTLFSGFGTAGQRCTSLGITAVHASVHEAFLERFTAAVESARIGDPFEDVLYGPMISRRFDSRFTRWLEHIEPHHRVSGSSAIGHISNSAPREGFVGDPEAGLFQHPVIVDGVTQEDLLYREETFGPIAPVATFETFDEARTSAACRVMETIGGRGQAIYLTHHRHVVEIAMSVCETPPVVHEL
jgi:aldehyde dehydrogenase (NAD+)